MSNKYQYKAKTFEGESEIGDIHAEDSNRVAEILSERNLIPIEIKKKRSFQSISIFGFMKTRLYGDLILFTRNLSTLYQAGIPILRALTIIKIGPIGGHFNNAILKIKDSIRAGMPLSKSMADFPAIFPQIYRSAIAAGELSGKLDQILDSLGDMLEREMDLNRKLKSAIRYPIIVLVAISIAFIIIITFVIPKFVTFYSKMGSELPAPTRLLIGLNHLITDYWVIFIGAFVALAFLVGKLYSTEGGRRYFDTKLLSLPIFGSLIIKGNIARFSHILKILHKSGIPLVSSLETLSGVIKNSRLSSEIKIMAEALKEGRGMAVGAEQQQYIPDMALQLMDVGIESGSLDEMLDQLAKHYGKDVDYISRHLVSFLEPILTIILGIFILIVALAIFLPMWNLIQTFRG
jgi:type II secretory pathway component PulF